MTIVKPELIDRVKQAQIALQQIQLELGQIAMLEVRKSALLQEAVNKQNEITQAVKDIQLIYGDGEVNPETGEFTPKK